MIYATSCQIIAEETWGSITENGALRIFPMWSLFIGEITDINIYISATPNFEKLVLSILSWREWSVDFFSTGIAKRNEEIVPTYFTRKFAKYGQNPQEMYSSITASGKLKIFSYHHLTPSRKDDRKWGYEHIGNMKKGIILISKDIILLLLMIALIF
ncbi:MAG: hypothetical protein AB8V19_00860 [Candidatus Midichloria sp.]